MGVKNEGFNPSDYDNEEDAYLAYCEQNELDPDSRTAQIWWAEYLEYLTQPDPDYGRGEWVDGHLA